MNIAALGSARRLKELREKASSSVTINEVQVSDLIQAHHFDVIIDLDLDDHPERYHVYQRQSGITVLACLVKRSAEQLFAEFGLPGDCRFFSANFLPGFINRNLLEAANPLGIDTGSAEQAAAVLGYSAVEWTGSRVGMVTPRIVYMIINEAYYTHQEGTALREDIDTGMRLGTNYPKGPFEWCADTGIRNVYQVLEAMYQDTYEERYKVCPLLKTEYLRSLTGLQEDF